MDDLFQESKIIIINETGNGMRIFDQTKPTCLATDLSKHCIGFWLFQKYCKCEQTASFCCKEGWKITLVGRIHKCCRFSILTGRRGISSCRCSQVRYFVLGCDNLVIAVGHKTLLKLFGHRLLENIPNARL